MCQLVAFWAHLSVQGAMWCWVCGLLQLQAVTQTNFHLRTSSLYVSTSSSALCNNLPIAPLPRTAGGCSGKTLLCDTTTSQR